MLIQFNFKNYKSFRDEAILDLSAGKISEYSERVVGIGGEHLLRTAAIYGSNASGKSNVYSAFEYMNEYVLNSLYYGDDQEAFKNNLPTPFLFEKKTETAETEFEVFFTIPGDRKEKTYNYGFCINENGITEEWLNTKAKTSKNFRKIFYRSKKNLDLSGIPKAESENIRLALEQQVLIVSLGAKLRVNICKTVRDWFLRNEFADFGNTVTSYMMSRTLPEGFAESKEVQQNVVRYLNSFDESIVGFEVEEVPPEDDSKAVTYKINALHRMIDSSELASIPLNQESAGTLKMFALYPELQAVMEEGGVYFIDELNARLHPLLVRNFILAFLNPNLNKNNAQLLFTTHDIGQLSERLFRRDEIWFTEKDKNGISSLYSLADFKDENNTKSRNEDDYEKNYLMGKYGAVPFLKEIKVD